MAKTPDLEKPMLKLSFGYSGEYIFPWEEGVQVLNLMKEAIPVTSHYENGKSTWRRRAANHVVASGFSPTEQAEMLMSPVEE